MRHSDQLMTLTFEYVDEYSQAASATTMCNGAPEEGGIGFRSPATATNTLLKLPGSAQITDGPGDAARGRVA